MTPLVHLFLISHAHRWMRFVRNGADFGILRMDFIKSCFVKISAETALAA